MSDPVQTIYGASSLPFIINGVVCVHPMGDIGPYINQVLPIRYATLGERLIWWGFKRPPLTNLKRA